MRICRHMLGYLVLSHSDSETAAPAETPAEAATTEAPAAAAEAPKEEKVGLISHQPVIMTIDG